MCQFSSLTPHDCRMAITPSFPIQGSKRGLGGRPLLAIYILKIWKAEKFKRILFMFYWSKLCHMAIPSCKGPGEENSLLHCQPEHDWDSVSKMPPQKCKKNENSLSCFVKDDWATLGSLRAPEAMVEPGRRQQQSPGRGAVSMGREFPRITLWPLSPPLNSPLPRRGVVTSLMGYFEERNWACSAPSFSLSTPLESDSSVPHHAGSLVDNSWPCV